MILLLVTAFFLTSCSKEDDTGDSDDPANLTIEVVSIDYDTYNVVIQASAVNTVQYHFYVGDSDTPEDANVTGSFQYTFDGYGMYSISVKAYGNSGRYISKSREITIEEPQGDPIPLSRGYFSPESYTGYSLVWQDEFNGSSLGPDWKYETGGGGWGNNELEYYRADNSWVADSVLTIEARKESFGGYQYTSTRIKTQGNFSFQYGRVDIRALLPQGQGIWPALWTLGESITSVSWPDCGEIDIMEMIGGSNRENTVHGTAHWEHEGTHASYGQSKTLPSGGYNFAESYHVFSIVWDENTITRVDVVPDAEKWLAATQVPLTVIVGLSDTAELPAALIPGQGGKNRFTIGRSWIQAMATFAGENGLESCFTFEIIPGLGHTMTGLMPYSQGALIPLAGK